ncbi:hypothetical protein SAMN05446635_4682 [Burkholderia sp. OK233]|nr:hypothetical protein SAMN05446635_4682 [Burkholderia sp. OK233]
MRAITLACAVLCMPISAIFSAQKSNADQAQQIQQAKDCASGHAGRYEINEFLDNTSRVADGRLVKQIDVPQARCYPHCANNQTDSYVYRINDASGDDLARPIARAEGLAAGTAQPFYSLQQADATTLQLTVRTQGAAQTWYVEADKLKRVVTSSKEITDHDSVSYNDPFFVVFDHATLPTLFVTVDEGSVELTASELDSNLLPVWLTEPIAPQRVDELVIYTLKVVKPGCR